MKAEGNVLLCKQKTDMNLLLNFTGRVPAVLIMSLTVGRFRLVMKSLYQSKQTELKCFKPWRHLGGGSRANCKHF